MTDISSISTIDFCQSIDRHQSMNKNWHNIRLLLNAVDFPEMINKCNQLHRDFQKLSKSYCTQIIGYHNMIAIIDRHNNVISRFIMSKEDIQELISFINTFLMVKLTTNQMRDILFTHEHQSSVVTVKRFSRIMKKLGMQNMIH